MGAYVYLNKSDIFNHLGKFNEAVEAFEISIRKYDGLNFLPDDTLICGVSLFYQSGDTEKYKEYMNTVLDKLKDMYASEFIDACKVVFQCSLDSGDYDLVDKIILQMDSYIHTHPLENKVGLQIEQLKYIYAGKSMTARWLKICPFPLRQGLFPFSGPLMQKKPLRFYRPPR